MRTAVSQAKGQLTELVRLAEAGEDVVFTRFGRDVVRLVPVSTRAAGRRKARPGPSAARSQDFLYDESGLPK